MKKIHLLIAATVLVVSSAAIAQPPVLKRTTYKTDKFDFGSGGTLSVVGAPRGSMRIEGWQKNEIEISAEIEVQAATETDLSRLAEVSGFILDESMGRANVVSVGAHDKKYLKRIGKKMPKNLIGLPFKIDYVIRVPKFCDLEIDGGKGDLTIAGIDGAMRINFLETNAKLMLVGGAIRAVFGTGTVDVTIPSRAWRGRLADVQLANGTMTIRLPPNLNAEIDATILRTGKIENDFADFKPRTRTAKFTDKSIVAKAGTGGVPLSFIVGDGILKFVKLSRSE